MPLHLVIENLHSTAIYKYYTCSYSESDKKYCNYYIFVGKNGNWSSYQAFLHFNTVHVGLAVIDKHSGMLLRPVINLHSTNLK